MKEIDKNEEMIYGLIIDELDNAISPENKLVLDKWRLSATANERVYQEFLSVHISMDKLFEKKGNDVHSSWEVLDKKLNAVDGEQELMAKAGTKRNLWFSIAASVLFVLSIGYYLNFKAKDEVISTGAAATFVVLPDSTRIDLNAGSSIRYDQRSFLKDRKIELLSGEIFIKITNHTLPQFKLAVGDLEVLDIGTSFNVSKTDLVVRVIVEKGLIALKQPRTDQGVVLTPGKLGTYDLKTKSLKALDNLDPNYKSWMDKEFIFSEVALSEVAAQLSNVYREKILISDAGLKNRKLTARLHYQTLDSVIAVISASLQCKAVKSNGAYRISAD